MKVRGKLAHFAKEGACRTGLYKQKSIGPKQLVAKPVRGGTMLSSEVAIINNVPEPKQSRRGRSKEPRELEKEATPLEDCVALLEEVVTRVEKQCSILTNFRADGR